MTGTARCGGTGGRPCRGSTRWCATTNAAAACLIGTSISDSYSLEAWVRDLETVVDALGLERFAVARNLSRRPHRDHVRAPATRSESAMSLSMGPVPGDVGEGDR